MRSDLYRNDGSILFSHLYKLETTNGKQTSVVISGYRGIAGFKQLNSSHVVIVDHGDHCIIMLKREVNSHVTLAGTCGTSGFEDGPSAKFNRPWGIEFDERNPGHLLITDCYNDALRSVDVTSGIVSTVIRTGLNYPAGLTWYNGRLLVGQFSYHISEVTWSSDGSVTNKILTGSKTRGYRDGDFTVAQFYKPNDIYQWRDGFFLIVDQDNKRFRLLDMTKRKVLPVCVGSTTNCTTSTFIPNNPRTLLVINDTVYVGTATNYIYKLVS